MIGPFNMEYFDKDDKFSIINSEEGYTGRCKTIENLCIVAREKSEETIEESNETTDKYTVSSLSNHPLDPILR